MTCKRIPMKAAKQIIDQYGHDQVVVVALDRESGQMQLVTYGKTMRDCREAARLGDVVAEALGLQDEKSQPPQLVLDPAFGADGKWMLPEAELDRLHKMRLRAVAKRLNAIPGLIRELRLARRELEQRDGKGAE